MNLYKLKKTFIIAEIGNNHEGSFHVACKLIQEAKKAGVDAVKFQTYKTERYVSINESGRFRNLKKFELSKEEFYKLSLLAKRNNLKFISTPFDLDSAIFLNKIVDCFKISSGDNNYYQLIEKVLGFKKTTFISTGLLNFKEISNLLIFIKNIRFNYSKLAFLYCVSAYPVPYNEANLLSIKFLKKKIPFTIGYSDHTLGMYGSVAACVLGATIIEKHFTLDNNYSKFRDHQLSLNPKNMKNLVDSIRLIEKMMGKEEKVLQSSENKNLFSMRRSIYSYKDIEKNSKIDPNNINIVRPFKLLGPNYLKNVIGKRAKIFIKKNSAISATDLKN
jgi:N,N'-diacetyllegionaminate synthase